MTLEPFQKRMLGDYFAGATETLILIPKKNGKTTLLAALALFHVLTVDDAECVVAAASREQAMILYDAATGFVRRSGLKSRLKTQVGYRQIRSLKDSGRIRVLAADVDTADGVRPTLALVDELHRHRSPALYGVFRDGLGPRDGRMVTISTAGERETSPLGLMRAAARHLDDRLQRGAYLRARSADGQFVMHEWALGPGDDLHDMRVVKKANPLSAQTRQRLQERHDSPTTQPWQWAAHACGLWVSAESWWVDPEQWAGAQSSDVGLEDGDRVTLGFDGARTWDATALIACRMSDGLLAPLGIWQNPGDGTDWEVDGQAVDAAVADAFERFDVVRFYGDPPFWYTEIDLWAMQFGSVVMRFHTSRARMTDAVERFRTDLAAGRVAHVGDSLLTRHVTNAQTRPVRGGYWLRKPGDGPDDKIDAAVAAVLAWEARADTITDDGGAGQQDSVAVGFR